MPAGCDFICKNENCKHKNGGFVFLAPWPLSKIEMVINSQPVVNSPELREKLINLKNNGVKYACIQLPNYDQVPVYAYRISLWSKDAKCIWQYDIECNGKTADEIVSENTIPECCEKTNCKLLNFSEALKEGILCPHCNEKMEQNRWYSNEQ